MFDIIIGNLDRQTRGLALLRSLLQEEFDLLRSRNTEGIMEVEFSIHELLRQLAHEKTAVQKLLGGGKLLDYAAMLPEEQGDQLRELWGIADVYEQRCARQASYNSELSLALLDVSKDTLDFLHSRLIQPSHSAYGRAGVYVEKHPDAAIISGRL